MIRHMFRLIWNRKKRHMLLMIEILCSFLVLYFVTSQAVAFVSRYMIPLGYDYEHVWKLDLGYSSAGSDVPDEELKQTLAQMEAEFKSHRDIESFSWAQGCMPYGRSTWSTSIEADGLDVHANFSAADDAMADVMRLNIIEGRWFSVEDNVTDATPIVVNLAMRRQLAEDTAIVGRRIADDPKDFLVVGVIDHYRFHGELDKHENMMFQRSIPFDSAGRMPEQALIRVRPGTTSRFEQVLMDNLSDIAPKWNMRIETLPDLRSSYLKDNLLRLLSMGSLAGFLVINVALGIFGVLWYSINRRRAEIALRRALGANSAGVSWQILGEALALATIALTAGIFLAVQVPILSLDTSIKAFEYTIAMLLSAVIIYILVFGCALYPSRLAMRILPAQALRDE